MAQKTRKAGTSFVATLADIARLLQTSKADDHPLDHIARLVRKTLHVDVCSLYLLEGKELILVATEGLNPMSVGQVRMPLTRGLTGLVGETLAPVITEQAQSHPRFEYFPETEEEKFSTFVGVPLLEYQELVGVLTIQTRAARAFSEESISMLSLIGFQLAPVIHNLATLKSLQEQARARGPTRRKFSGLGTSPGFAIGSATILQSHLGTLVTQEGHGSLAEEKARLTNAIRKADRELKTLQERLLKKLSKQEAEIFNAHRMILKDRSFREKLNREIKKKKSAEQAVIHVIEQYLKTFAQMRDPYFQERAHDLEDLGQRLLGRLQTRDAPEHSVNQQGILIANRLTPSETALLEPEKIQAIVTVHGGRTSHAAILARSLGIPAIMGIDEEVLTKIQSGDLVIVDGNTGNLFVNPSQEILKEYERIQEKYADHLVHLNVLAETPAITKDGRRVYLDANVGLIGSLQHLKRYGAEAVGLYRTEFPFMIRDRMPNEEEQYKIYRQILELAVGLPVTFRTLDPGGDKPISYLHLTASGNPFLGYRSIRFCLGEPHILKTQLKALFRASTQGPIRILFPMISSVEEIRQVKKILQEVRRDLKKRKDPPKIARQIPIGIMIEVPSAVHLSHHLIKEVDFFSVGTNDLIQYTLAVDRNDEKVAHFFEPFHPAVIQSLWKVVRSVHQAGKWISICGEMAGDPAMTPLLVGLGFDRLSMTPSNIPLIKKNILELKYSKLLKEMDKILEFETAAQVKKRLGRYQVHM